MPHPMETPLPLAEIEAPKGTSGLVGAIALTSLAVDAGLALHLTLAEVADSTDGATGETLRRAAVRAQRGVPFDEALSTGGSELHPLVERYVSLLARASIDGQYLRGPLDSLLLETRRSELADLEVAAHRASVLMTLPLVLCVLPAFLLLTIAPLVISVVAELTP
ncbi:MAG: type II secretion system F family protein [Acidimicrobiales bacterium]